jgi:hypothetical protein
VRRVGDNLALATRNQRAKVVVPQRQRAAHLRFESGRQFDRQERLHRWLHGWLLVHLPLSIVLIVLMLVHIYTALKYR